MKMFAILAASLVMMGSLVEAKAQDAVSSTTQVSVNSNSASSDSSDIQVKKVVTRTYNNMLSETETQVVENGQVSNFRRWNISFLGISASGSNDSQYGTDESSMDNLQKRELADSLVALFDKSDKKSQHKKSFSEHYPCLYFGIMDLQSDDIPVKAGASWEWGMYPFSTCWSLFNSRSVALTTAFGFSRSSLRLKNNNAIFVDDAGRMQCGDIENLNFSKPRLIYWSWKVPVSIEWQPKTKNNFFFTAGVEGEMRHHVKSRAHVGSENKYVINHSSLETNTWGYSFLFQMGWDDFGFIGRINMTDILNRDYCGWDTQPFMVGVGFGF